MPADVGAGALRVAIGEGEGARPRAASTLGERLLRLAPAFTVALFAAPILAGLVGTLLPAFGYFPPIGGERVSLDPWRTLFATPGLATALRLTLTAGFLATLVSLGLAAAFCALAHDRPSFRHLERLTAPLLAAPHAAVAVGFAFLILPSGWVVRLLSPDLSGWDRPPAIVTLRDPFGLAFTAGLLLKEVPYLVLMMIAAATQVRAREAVAAGRAMGYAPATVWLKAVLPQVYGQIRLPVYAVLAFSLSVVEVPLVLAPSNPPPLSVLAARWFSDYDLRLYFPAAAAAVLQLLVVVGGILLWRSGEALAWRLARAWVARGGRRGAGPLLVGVAGAFALLVGAAGLFSLAGMALWSVAEVWRFPDDLPSRVGLQTWNRHADQVWPSAATTVAVATVAAVAAVALVLACLENEQRRGLRPGAGALWVLYLPLLVPQIAFLFGTQVVLVRLRLDGTFLAVVWAHLLFVLPYVFLSLADPWRALDGRYARISAGLGASPGATFFRVKLPMLLRPVLVALAVGFAVSVGQYLPTLFAGAGRVATLTTDAVTLSGGSDRRIIGVYAVLQAGLPLLVYGGALLLPALLYRRRRGLA